MVCLHQAARVRSGGDSDDRPVWLEEVSEVLRIPSVSADPDHHDDVVRAAEWVRDFVRAAGGECELVQGTSPRPLVIGELRASRNADSAPSVLVYGHFDVQPPAPLDKWESPPFEPEIRGEWLFARGVADDKGQLYLLLKAAALLAAEGALPVNVRIACDGEEEVGGHAIVDWLAEDERGADAAVVFDAHQPRRGQPAFYVATRGICYFHVKVRTGGRDLHSGTFGGGALNALHALMQAFSGVLARDGRLPEQLREGVVPPTDEELAGWAQLHAGRRGARGPGRASRGRPGGRGVLPADVRRAVGRRPRDRGRLAAAPEDGDSGRRGGELLDPARPGAAPGRDRAEGRAAPP